MPVVARNILKISGRTVSLFLMAIVVTGVIPASFGQDASAPAEQPPAVTPPADEAAVPAATPAGPAAAAPAKPADPCEQTILEEQQKTRVLREMRQPLPVADKQAVAKLKRDYSPLLAGGFTSEADTQKVREYLSWLILRATDPEFAGNPENIRQLLKDVESDVQRCGTNIGNANSRNNARRKFCGEMLTICKKMLDNSLDARVTAVTIMKMLHDEPAVSSGPPAKIHHDALSTLVEILNSKEQPDSVKVFAADALRNVLRNCDVVEQDQFRICDAIGTELERPCTQAAFQQTLLEALLDVKKPRRTVGNSEPTSMKYFASVLNDRSRPIEVRCLAAFGVGQGAFDAQIKFEALSWKVAQLAGDVSIEFNKDPGNPKWPTCGAWLFFTYRHLDNAGVAERKGLLNRVPQAAAVTEAAPLVSTIARVLIANNAKITAAEAGPLAQWIKANEPTNWTWDANVAPLTP